MTKEQKIIIEAYLLQSLENFEIMAGRIILNSENDTVGAGMDEMTEAIVSAKKYFLIKIQEVKELICQKYRSEIEKINSKADSGIELVGYIAALLESNNISLGGLNYLFLSAWIVKNGIFKLCEE